MWNRFKILFIEIKKIIYSEKFLILTIFLPSILIFLIFVPYNMLQQEPPKKKRIGVLQIGEVDVFPILESVLYRNMITDISAKEYELMLLEPDSTPKIDSLNQSIEKILLKRDSLNEKLENLVQYRQRIFKSKRIRQSSKKRLLEKSFLEMQSVKSQLAQIDSIYKVLFEKKLSLLEHELRKKADSLLNTGDIDIYLVFNETSLKKGLVEYHAYNAGEFLDTEILDKSVSQALLHVKLLNLKLPEDKINFVMNPFQKEEYWVVQQKKEPFNIVGGYVVPVFLALLTVISLILNAESFFLRILNDKSQKLFELIFYKRSIFFWLILRIIPALIASLLQIALWIGLVYLSYKFGIIQMKEFFLLKDRNMEYFLLEYIMGFLSLSLIYLFLMPFINTRESRYSFLIQVFRVVLFLPIIFAFVFIKNLYPPLTSILLLVPFYLPTLHLIYVDFNLYIGEMVVITNAIILLILFILFVIFVLYLKRLKFEWMSANFKVKEILPLRNLRISSFK